jgi:putative sigma-54 modulation protein
MQMWVKGRNVEVTESVRQYTERKLMRLAPQLADDPTQMEVELAVENNPSIAADHVAELTVWTKGPTLRAREQAESFEVAVDLLADKIERQVKKRRSKVSQRDVARRLANRGQVPNGAAPEEPEFSAEQLERMIVKSKQFELQPITPDEAAVQLELVGHDFYVFRNVDTGRTNVVYRRRGGGYGLIEPAA